MLNKTVIALNVQLNDLVGKPESESLETTPPRISRALPRIYRCVYTREFSELLLSYIEPSERSCTRIRIALFV